MTRQQHEALRLANLLEQPGYGYHSTPVECAAELRRLHSANVDLLEALIECEYIIDHCLFGCDAENLIAKARAAIAKSIKELK
jgi:hypothetical protein